MVCPGISLANRLAVNGEAEAENATLSDRNATLTRELMALQSGDEAVEQNARENLGLIKEGEVYYQFIDEPDSP